MTRTESPKTAKRAEPEQQFFESESTDRLGQMLLVMASEIHVLRDRVRCLEFMLAKNGSIDVRALDRFEPSPEQAAVLQQDRETFVAHLFEVLDGRAKSTSGAGHLLVPPAPAP